MVEEGKIRNLDAGVVEHARRGEEQDQPDHRAVLDGDRILPPVRGFRDFCNVACFLWNTLSAGIEIPIAEEKTSEDIIEQILNTVDVP